MAAPACPACRRLATANRDLSSEVERLTGQAVSLTAENDRLRLALAAHGNGRDIPRGTTVIVRPALAKVDDREWEQRHTARPVPIPWDRRSMTDLRPSDPDPAAPPPVLRPRRQQPLQRGPRPSPVREAMIDHLRQHGWATIDELANLAGSTPQAVRQQARKWRQIFQERRDPGAPPKATHRIQVGLASPTKTNRPRKDMP